MSIFPSGMFSIDPKSTPEQLAARKAMIAMLRPKYGSARYVGEGLGQLATGIVEGLQNRKMREIEGAGRDSANDLFSGLFGKTSQSTSGQSGPMNILGVDPGYAAPTKPDPLAPSMGQDADKPIYPNKVTPGGYAMGADVPGAAAGGSADAIFRAELIAGGLPEHVADGILMNAFDESGFNPGIVGDNGAAFGLLQWNGPRKRALEQFAAQVGGNPADPRIQAQFTLYELNGPEGAAGRALAGAKTPGEAAAIFLNQYERPAEVHRAKREAKYLGGGGTLYGGPVAAPAGASMATNSAMPNIDPQALASALANPWLSPEQRSVLMTIYDQQVQAGDPLRQIEIAKGVAELDAMNNPPAPEQPEQLSRLAIAKEMGLDDESARVYALTGELPQTADANVPAAFASLDMQAQAAGFAPGTPEYQEFMRNGGGSGTPAAFTALDMQAKAAGFEPGEPEYQEFMATRGAGFVAAAKAKGEDRATLESLESKMPGLEEVVGQLNALAEKATYTYTGQALDFAAKQLGLEPREAAVARAEYIAMVDNQVLPLLRDTFGAAFTVKEGETLRATLGDPNKSPQEKKAVLDAFIEQKKRDVAALKSRTGMSADQPPAAIPQGVDPALWEFMTPEERALFQ